MFRITGTPENIRAALKYSEYSDTQIQEAIDGSITKNNYQTTKSSEYKQEISDHLDKKQNKPQGECYEWEQMLWFSNNLKDAKIENKKGPVKGQNAPVQQQRVGTGFSLKEKVAKLVQGKLLDVSDMTPDMKKINTRDIPKTSRSGKHYSSPVPFMSNDISKYIKAIEFLYGPEGLVTYADNIEDVRRAIQGLKSVQTIGINSNIPPPNILPINKSITPAKLGNVIAPIPTFKPTSVPSVKSPKTFNVGTIGGTGFPQIPSIK